MRNAACTETTTVSMIAVAGHGLHGWRVAPGKMPADTSEKRTAGQDRACVVADATAYLASGLFNSLIMMFRNSMEPRKL